MEAVIEGNDFKTVLTFAVRILLAPFAGSLIAPSLASAPLLAKNTRSNTEFSVSRSASSIDGAL